MKAKPGKEHTWLHRFIGDWEAIHVDPQNPDAEVDTHGAWKEHVRQIGDVWIIAESEGPMPDGSTGQMVITLGYDTGKKQFVGTWIGSMMDMIWHYTGSLDESGRVLTLDSEGPAMDGSGRIVRMRDILEIGNDGERVMRGAQQMEDGSWTEFMRMRYSRIG